MSTYTGMKTVAKPLRPPRSLRLYSVDKQQRMPDAVALFARRLAHLTK